MSYPGYGAPYGQPPPPQGYGQPHPPPQHGHYPPPQKGHYPPPQGGHYPPPLPGGYVQPPPPPGYPSYGAPPLGQYGAPPPPPQPYGHASPAPPGQYGAQSYGAPPPQGYGAPSAPTPPSLGYGPPQFAGSNDTDARELRKAMKGFGTDEKTLIRILTARDPIQINNIRISFQQSLGRNLINDIKNETSGWFETALVQLAYGPLLADVHLLHWAMTGPGTKEVVLNDILLCRSNADLQAIKSAYKQTFHDDLEKVVKGDLSMKTERHFMMVLAARRAEDSAAVIPQQVDDDVMQLYKATEGKMGTDEILVCSILTNRNDNQIRAIAHAYEQKFNRSLDKVIKSEFSGHMRDALLSQLRHAVDKYMHAADLLEEAMAGMGTKDHLLVARTIRVHWDRNMLANVKAAYQQKYRRSLASRIHGETSGDYRKTLLACIGEPI